MNSNTHFLMLNPNYLFSEINRRVDAWSQTHPETTLLRLGIGDVTQPLCSCAITALHRAVDEMGKRETFHGYGPEQGYVFLREAIVQYYSHMGVRLTPDEIFVSDGAKSDLGNMTDLFSTENLVLIPDPVYPVYVDSNRMQGRPVYFLKADTENNFLPPPPKFHADIVYLCSPNNPTGAVYSLSQLQEWVEYAIKEEAVLLFDAAYEAFIRDPELPRSIYQADGAERCAIEFCSLSKTAGFTGTRCGYTVVPAKLKSGGQSLRQMWLRRQTTKFNGVPYIIQRAAEAVLTAEGQAQCREAVDGYLQNAEVLASVLRSKNIWFTGGQNSPYLWMRCPDGMTSWAFFDHLLSQAGIIGTPGSGFGICGEGFFRLSAFGQRKTMAEAAKRLGQVLS